MVVMDDCSTGWMLLSDVAGRWLYRLEKKGTGEERETRDDEYFGQWPVANRVTHTQTDMVILAVP
jgi:hypothetical protein